MSKEFDFFNDNSIIDDTHNIANNNNMNTGLDIDNEVVDVREKIKELGVPNKIEKDLAKIGEIIFNKTSLKNISKLKESKLLEIDNPQKGLIEIKHGYLSSSFNFNPSIKEEDLLYYSEKNNRNFSSVIEYLRKQKNEDIKIKNVFPYKGKIIVNLQKAINPQESLKVMEILKYAPVVYIGNNLDTNEIHYAKTNQIILDITTMKNTGIWGEPGSGKSVLLRNIILSALKKENNLFNFLILEKSTDFINLSQFKGVLYNNAVANISMEELFSIFIYLGLEYSRRSKLLNEKGVDNLKNYNELVDNEEEKLPYLILVIDEYKELRDVLKKQSSKDIDIDEIFGDSLARLIQVSRATGIFIWGATQKITDKEGIHKRVRDLLTTWIIGKTKQAEQIRAINYIERKLAIKYLYQGDFIISVAGENTIFRSPLWTSKLVNDNISEFDIKPDINGINLFSGNNSFDDIKKVREYFSSWIVKQIEELALNLNIDLLTPNLEQYENYGLNTEKLNELKGLKKIALIIFLNQFIEFYEKVKDMIANTNNVPEEFDYTKILQQIKTNPKYEALGLLFDYSLFLYELYIKDFIKNNFKFSSKKKIIEEGSDEEKAQLLDFYNQKVFDLFNNFFRYFNLV